MVRRKREFAVRYSHYVNSFAAGALITIALAHLIPESVEMSGDALLAVLVSFIAFYLLEAALVYHSGSAIHYHESRPQHLHGKGPVVFSGLFLHSLIDGFIIALGFEVSTQLGLFAATGVILHELPEGVTSFALLLRTLNERTTFYLSLAIAIATPLGAIIALGPLRALSPGGLGILMAVAGGSFLYVAASDLIPEAHENGAFPNALFFLAGASFLYALSALLH